ncbi:hypothetical protein [Streptomyces avermitilis]|uniref:hypothetical protein n=1 Tax=Streptomyces avermitilis TaxID=33903 RepID=UPI00382AE0B0
MIDSARQSLLVALGEHETIALSRGALACVLPLARCPPHLQEGADGVELEQATTAISAVVRGVQLPHGSASTV